jgi:hypothetical protein
MSLVGGLLGSTMWAGLMKAISPKDRSGWDTFGDSVLGSLVGTAMGTAFARVAATNAIVQCLNDHDDE